MAVMNLKLHKPSQSIFPAFQDFIEEMRLHGETLWAPYIPQENESAEQFISRLEQREIHPPAPLVPETIYWAMMDNKVVGRISLRHRIEGNLTKMGGHIGYEVRPSFRNRGFAKEMLRQILETPKVKEIGNLLLTCSPKNEASKKTIIANGGMLTNTVFVDSISEDRNHYWIHKNVPRFETKRLILREISMDDAGSYQKNFAEWEIIRQLAPVVPWPYPENGAREFIEKVIIPNQGRDRWWWGLFVKSNPKEIIGVVDFYRKRCPDNRGFWLARKHWGQGLMAEALQPLITYSFNQLGFDKLIFSNALGNEQSRKIKEKTGAKFLRTEPAKFVDPSYTHRELWEMDREDWLKFLPR